MKEILKNESGEVNDASDSGFDHKEPEDDDCGLPESPIYSNYSKYLWKRGVNIGDPRASKRSPKNPKPAISTK